MKEMKSKKYEHCSTYWSAAIHETFTSKNQTVGPVYENMFNDPENYLEEIEKHAETLLPMIGYFSLISNSDGDPAFRRMVKDTKKQGSRVINADKEMRGFEK
mmetsp:Transcript_80397/g.181442  ORF Transcript_80397/g.181442 Transcript_80397/m.181442 type:complete len:102 (+) Transcript_80397:880-1185(+)